MWEISAMVAFRLPGSALAVAVLKLLDERPMHPYEMQQLIRERHLDDVLKLNSGSLYHAVQRLDRAGLIAGLETNREGRRPERTVYTITDAGRDAFQAWLRRLLSEPAREYPQFATALACMVHLTPEEVVQLLRHRLVLLEAALAAGERIQHGAQEGGLARLHLVEFEYGQVLRRAEAGWLRALITEIADGTLDGGANWAAFHAGRATVGAERPSEEVVP
jgi:DNA-binding PadR family transcriptional regulator